METHSPITLPPLPRDEPPRKLRDFVQALCACIDNRIQLAQAFAGGEKCFVARQKSEWFYFVSRSSDQTRAPWRMTHFDPEGWPCSHAEFATWHEAAREAVRSAVSVGDTIPSPRIWDGTVEELLSQLRANRLNREEGADVVKTLVLVHRLCPGVVAERGTPLAA